jgi:hypothetical protein
MLALAVRPSFVQKMATSEPERKWTSGMEAQVLML